VSDDVPLLGTLPSEQPSIAQFGIKGAYLHWASARGERVPEGFVLTPTQTRELLEGRREPLERALSSLCGLLTGGASLAVRASPTFALPGALPSELEIPVEASLAATVRAVRDSIARIYAALASPVVQDLLDARGIEPSGDASLAVVVQRFIRVRTREEFGAVACSRSPLSGEAGLMGEYVPGQGASAVVGGRMRPLPLRLRDAPRARPEDCLEAQAKDQLAELSQLVERLEHALSVPVEVEVVRDRDALFLIELRPLELSARALAHTALEAIRAGRPKAQLLVPLAARVARELVEHKLSEETARAAPLLSSGLAASPGVVSGILGIDPERVFTSAAPVVLIRRHAVPEDIALFRRVKGVITTSGGLTSHAAVIARGLGLCAVVGATELRIDVAGACVFRSDEPASAPPLVRQGEWVTLDGGRGRLYAGRLPTIPTVGSDVLRSLLSALSSDRRVPLWALGPEQAVEAAVQGCALSGGVVTAEPGSIVSDAVQWVALPSQEALRTVELPPDAGVCMPARPETDFAALRAALSRPLGATFDRDAPRCDVPLDLAIASADYPHFDSLSAALRLVRADDFEAAYTRLGHPSTTTIGLACSPEQAAEWALRLATAR
jgi:phosphoenolpyruvate synthase/pyruvate phosphate dikinase